MEYNPYINAGVIPTYINLLVPTLFGSTIYLQGLSDHTNV